MASELNECVLLVYARAFLRHWPDAQHEFDATKQWEPGLTPELQVLRPAVTQFLGDPNWFADKWPGRNIVTFFSWANDNVGFTSTWSVNVDKDKVESLL